MSNFQHTHGQPPRGDQTRRLRAGIVTLIGAAGLMAGLAIAQVPTASAPAAASGVTVNAPVDLTTLPTTNPQPSVHPNWAELPIVQQRILAPLAPEWNGMPELARKKWLQIAQAYPKYTPAQQQRLQTRMADWVKLTPEQRHRARENFQTTKSVPVQKKSEAWQSYQQLTDDQKKALAAAAKAQKHPSAVTALPGSASLAKDASKALHHGARTKPGTTKSMPTNKATAAASVPAATPVPTPAPAPAAAAPAPASAPLTPAHPVAPSTTTGGESSTPPPSTVLGG